MLHSVYYISIAYAILICKRSVKKALARLNVEWEEDVLARPHSGGWSHTPGPRFWRFGIQQAVPPSLR